MNDVSAFLSWVTGGQMWLGGLDYLYNMFRKNCSLTERGWGGLEVHANGNKLLKEQVDISHYKTSLRYYTFLPEICEDEAYVILSRKHGS